MPPKFGTSGLRGLVTELSADLVGSYVSAFARSCPVGTGVFVAHDLRPSSPSLAAVVIQASRAAGVPVIDCGAVPTPALALAASEAGAAAVMVTGSHIPTDRNGLKFYTPTGEITKAQEAGILDAVAKPEPAASASVPEAAQGTDAACASRYIDRYVAAFGPDALGGMRLGIYAHSAVGRDVLATLLRALGATTIELGRADDFVPVDTEAVDAQTRDQLRNWAAAHQIDAIVSTDADGDRPLLTDEHGQVIAGDILGQITGLSLGAEVAVTPVTSNTGAEQVFGRVIRTTVGSPYVIAGMQAEAAAKVIGYEANGGFLLGYHANGLAPLMTRDAVLPLVTCLAQAKALGGLAAVVARQPARFTAADRLQNIATRTAQELVARLTSDAQYRGRLTGLLDGVEAATDTRDGLRISLRDGRIIHLRPSGNAPELRLYVDASDPACADQTLQAGLAAVETMIGTKK